MIHYRYLPYTLTLHSSAIITAPGGDPNSSATLSYIPGTTLRGAIATALGDPGDDMARKQEFHDLVLGGKVSCLNAYPFLMNRRSLPTPVSLRMPKHEPENSAKTDLCAFEQEDWPGEELRPIGERFLVIGTAQPHLYHPNVSSRIHNQRDRQKGRAWKNQDGNTQGAVFTFESLDAGQMFEGVIQLRHEQHEELDRIEKRIKELLGNTLLVGRSRRAGYGGMASLAWGKNRSREVVGDGIDGLRVLNRGIAENERFRILLTSPCIVRNQNTGQIDPSYLEEEMLGRLGKKAEKITGCWSFEVIGGFNRKWRLELPQNMAVSAGSLMVFEATQALSFDEMQTIECEGIGERKAEGLGRLVFLDAPRCRISLPVFTESSSEIPISGTPQDPVVIIEKRIVQRQIARTIEEKGVVLAAQFEKKDLPKNSLIGRLRTQLRGSDNKTSINTLKKWLDDSDDQKLRKHAMDQLKQCTMRNGTDLRSWMLSVLDGRAMLDVLNVDVLSQRYNVISVESAKSVINNETETSVVKLIDAVLAAMSIRNNTQEDGDGQ